MIFLLKILLGSLNYLCQAVSVAMLIVAMNRAGWVTGAPNYLALELYIRLYQPKPASKTKRPFGLEIRSRFAHWKQLNWPKHLFKQPKPGKRS